MINLQSSVMRTRLSGVAFGSAREMEKLLGWRALTRVNEKKAVEPRSMLCLKLQCFGSAGSIYVSMVLGADTSFPKSETVLFSL